MSAKIAKRIRKEINYHPRDPRKYVLGKRGIEIDPTDKRSLYQEMKKER